MKNGFLTLLLGLLLSASAARAQDLTFLFSGTASGTAGELSFTDAPFSVTVTANSADIGPSPLVPPSLSVPSLSAAFEIQMPGIGAGVITDDVTVLAIESDVYFIDDGGLIYFRLDTPLVDYELGQAVAPISVSVIPFETPIPTSAGNLTFTSFQNPVLSVNAAPVPEPSAALLGIGAAAGMLLMRRRRAA